MLQRIREGVGRWVFGVILALIAVSFIFWGVDFNMTGPSYAARVNGEEIPLEEFDRNLQAEQSQFQELYRVELDDATRTQLRRNVVDRLVRQEALSQRVEEAGYRVSDQRLTESIQSESTFQVGGQFSMDAYRAALALQGMSMSAFEALQREQLELLDLQMGIVESTFITPDQFRRFIELMNQRRRISYALFEVESFLDDVEITDEEIAAYYEENASLFMTEQAAQLEYIELRRADVAEQIDVSEEELREYYEDQRDQFRTEEERRASHILITQGSDETTEEARARAEAALERIRAGEEFDAVAAEVSEDPGTAETGGDLGWISRGMLAGPFEETLYAMEEGEIEGPVQTDFGFHLIRLDDIREGEEESFEEVRDQLLDEYRTRLADDRFYDRANQLADLAFDSYDALAPVASELGLDLQTLERYPRSGDPQAFPNNAPVVDAVFGPEAVEVGINSPLLELSDEHVAVVRVLERLPPEQQPLEEVTAEIRQLLERERAQALAAEAADAFAAALPEEITADFVRAEDAENADGEQAEAEGAEGDGGDADAAAVADADADASADGGADTDAADSDAADAEAPEAALQPTSPAAALAMEHGGTWVGPMWVERSDASVPTEILAQAFDLPEPDVGERLRELVAMAAGDRAVLILSEVEPGDPDEVPEEQRTALQQQMMERAATGELGGYALSVREEAEVTVPPEVLEPQF